MQTKVSYETILNQSILIQVKGVAVVILFDRLGVVWPVFTFLPSWNALCR